MSATTGSRDLNRIAFSATVHCLTGCAIGEVLGMIIGTALGWGDLETIALAVVLAYFAQSWIGPEPGGGTTELGPVEPITP